MALADATDSTVKLLQTNPAAFERCPSLTCPAWLALATTPAHGCAQLAAAILHTTAVLARCPGLELCETTIEICDHLAHAFAEAIPVESYKVVVRKSLFYLLRNINADVPDAAKSTLTHWAVVPASDRDPIIYPAFVKAIAQIWALVKATPPVAALLATTFAFVVDGMAEVIAAMAAPCPQQLPVEDQDQIGGDDAPEPTHEHTTGTNKRKLSRGPLSNEFVTASDEEEERTAAPTPPVVRVHGDDRFEFAAVISAAEAMVGLSPHPVPPPAHAQYRAKAAALINPKPAAPAPDSSEEGEDDDEQEDKKDAPAKKRPRIHKVTDAHCTASNIRTQCLASPEYADMQKAINTPGADDNLLTSKAAVLLRRAILENWMYATNPSTRNVFEFALQALQNAPSLAARAKPQAWNCKERMVLYGSRVTLNWQAPDHVSGRFISWSSILPACLLPPKAPGRPRSHHAAAAPQFDEAKLQSMITTAVRGSREQPIDVEAVAQAIRAQAPAAPTDTAIAELTKLVKSVITSQKSVASVVNTSLAKVTQYAEASAHALVHIHGAVLDADHRAEQRHEDTGDQLLQIGLNDNIIMDIDDPSGATNKKGQVKQIKVQMPSEPRIKLKDAQAEAAKLHREKLAKNANLFARFMKHGGSVILAPPEPAPVLEADADDDEQ